MEFNAHLKEFVSNFCFSPFVQINIYMGMWWDKDSSKVDPQNQISLILFNYYTFIIEVQNLIFSS